MLPDLVKNFKPQELLPKPRTSVSNADQGLKTFTSTAAQRFVQTAQQALEVPLLCTCQHHLGKEMQFLRTQNLVLMCILVRGLVQKKLTFFWNFPFFQRIHRPAFLISLLSGVTVCCRVRNMGQIGPVPIWSQKSPKFQIRDLNGPPV